MAIQALGYLGIGSAKLEDWSDFAGVVLGMQAVDRGGGMRAFRMDDRKQRLIIDAAMAEGERVFGWEVGDASALDAFAARLEAAGKFPMPIRSIRFSNPIRTSSSVARCRHLSSSATRYSSPKARRA